MAQTMRMYWQVGDFILRIYALAQTILAVFGGALGTWVMDYVYNLPLWHERLRHQASLRTESD